MNIKHTIIALFLFLFAPLFTQENVSVTWQSVGAGEILTSPKLTSYGFISISEGNLMNAVTETGVVLWRRTLNGVASPFYSITNDNFLYITSDNANTLSLYNPDGLFLWEVTLVEPAIQDPVIGRDGRVYIVSNNSISCYGVKGLLKWNKTVFDKTSLPLTEMNDGSVLYIYNTKNNHYSSGIRISPYGELLEEIDFIDAIHTIKSFNNGVIITFVNGSVGVCEVVNSSTQTIWSTKEQNNLGKAQQIILGQDHFGVLYEKNFFVEYSFMNQSENWTIKMPSQLLNKELYTIYYKGMYIITSTEFAIAYYGQNSTDSLIAWQKNIHTDDNASYAIVTNSAYLIVPHKNWVISGFKLIEDSEKNYTTEVAIQKEQRYESFTFGKSIRGLSTDTISTSLHSGLYAANEAHYIRYIESKIQEYELEYFTLSDSVNIAEKARVYYVASQFQSSHFNYLVPYILSNEKDPYFIQLSMQIAANIAYDPQEIMLVAIEKYYFANKSSASDDILIGICDAVGEICKYMGRPSLTARGKQILSDITRNSSNVRVRNKANEVFRSFIEFEN